MFVMVQIYPEGIRHIRADKRVNEWRTPGKKNITKCAVNQRQVVIALTGGELVYFEMDPVMLRFCVSFGSSFIMAVNELTSVDLSCSFIMTCELL